MIYAFIGAALALGLVWVLTRRLSFARQNLSVYAGQVPVFDPVQHLAGPMRCEGVIFGPLGRVSSRFSAEMNGVWQGETGVLTEDFRYAGGRVQARRWALRLLPGGQIAAEAPDVPGGGRGAYRGNALRLRYKIRLEPEAGGHLLSVTDWLFVLDSGTLVNRSEFRKFGLKVGELQAVMTPLRGP